MLRVLGEAQHADDPSRGILRGIAVCPGTPLEVLPPLLAEVDYVMREQRRSSGSRRTASACLGTLMPAPASWRTIRARTRRSLDVRATRLVRMTLAGMFA